MLRRWAADYFQPQSFMLAVAELTSVHKEEERKEIDSWGKPSTPTPHASNSHTRLLHSHTVPSFPVFQASSFLARSFLFQEEQLKQKISKHLKMETDFPPRVCFRSIAWVPVNLLKFKTNFIWNQQIDTKLMQTWGAFNTYRPNFFCNLVFLFFFLFLDKSFNSSLCGITVLLFWG